MKLAPMALVSDDMAADAQMIFGAPHGPILHMALNSFNTPQDDACNGMRGRINAGPSKKALRDLYGGPLVAVALATAVVALLWGLVK